MKVSVAICTFNGEQYIEDQINSILHQSRIPDEIILGDDGSSDLTVHKAIALLDEGNVPYQIIENKEKLGLFANFQNVIMHCSGDIIFTSDQDDVWLEDKVKIIENQFLNFPKEVLVFSDGYVTDSNLKIIGDLWDSVSFSVKKQTMIENGQYYDVLLGRNYITGAAMAFRSSFAKKAFPTCLLKEDYLHDYWLALMAPLYGEIGLITKPLFYYRQHEKNLIGLKSQTLKAKINRWFASTKYSFIESEKFNRFVQDIYAQAKNIDDCKYQKILEGWEKFCSWRNSLVETRKAKAIISILRHMIQRQYKMYYSYAFSGCQDLIARLIMKK